MASTDHSSGLVNSAATETQQIEHLPTPPATPTSVSSPASALKLPVRARDRVFTCFSKLPIELRLIVWTFSKRDFARIHEIRRCKPYLHLLISGQKNPLLSTNQESRHVALKTCIQIFSPEYFFPKHSACLFDYEIDTLYFNINILYRLTNGPTSNSIKTRKEVTALLNLLFGSFVDEAKKNVKSIAGSPNFFEVIIGNKELLLNFYNMKELIHVQQCSWTKATITGFQDLTHDVHRQKKKLIGRQLQPLKESNEDWKKPVIRVCRAVRDETIDPFRVIN